MEELLDRIAIDPSILAGKTVIKGTRIPVYLIVGLVANGLTTKQILEEDLELKPDDIKAALLYKPLSAFTSDKMTAKQLKPRSKLENPPDLSNIIS